MFYGSPPIVTNGLILYLDAANQRSYVSGSNTWYDLSGNNLTGSLTSTGSLLPQYTTSNGGGLVFDGASNYVFFGSPAALQVQSFTINAWFAIPSACSGFIVINRGYAYSILVSSNNLLGSTVFPTSNVGNSVSTTAYSLSYNTLYNVSMVYGNYNLGMYLNNGNYRYIASPSGSVYYSGGAFGIGRDADASDSYFTGIIYSVQMYNRALSPQEISQNYNAIKSRFNLT